MNPLIMEMLDEARRDDRMGEAERARLANRLPASQPSMIRRFVHRSRGLLMRISERVQTLRGLSEPRKLASAEE